MTLTEAVAVANKLGAVDAAAIANAQTVLAAGVDLSADLPKIAANPALAIDVLSFLQKSNPAFLAAFDSGFALLKLIEGALP